VSKKAVQWSVLALVVTLMIAAAVVSPLPKPKRKAMHITSVNHVASVTITFTNPAMLKPSPVLGH
jgi:hypothetical protein